MFRSIQSAIHPPMIISRKIDATTPTLKPIAVPNPGQITVPNVLVVHIIPLLKYIIPKLEAAVNVPPNRIPFAFTPRWILS